MALGGCLTAPPPAARRMLTVDPLKRITCEGMLAHPWLAAGPRWELLGASVYMVRTDAASGTVAADEALLGELAQAGYPRALVLQVGGRRVFVLGRWCCRCAGM